MVLDSQHMWKTRDGTNFEKWFNLKLEADSQDFCLVGSSCLSTFVAS